jgi:hypothetical protein
VSAALPPLPFEPGDTANLACIHSHEDATNVSIYGAQHTLSIDRDERDGDDPVMDDENVVLTIIWDGQPVADITVDRVALLAALGVDLDPAVAWCFVHAMYDGCEVEGNERHAL